ncbi:dsDNA nuclease domain-containing protein [Pedobacter sp. MC2016-24]|uniref:dsDNA nuclease domain-containing protein n=1 Tax=Pedobacter sp. MC2016-24 TaxID=2780090 RepID=UPI0018816216|nr:dsDNA nuclease domain-containing protein [Pedobacter sp. MC2016-24]MBE9601477.1 DUF4297 domain-containing protein [Pedobacter sp. MC2016-24]
MAVASKAVNAGVSTATGIEFQKHCALYILFENYGKLAGKKYFICIEHHDDVMFCHQGPMDELTLVESYQAKKSSDKWGMSDTFFDILTKMAKVGLELEEDPVSKSPTYSHSLEFLTNHAINLNLKQAKPKPSINVLINEANCNVKFIHLPQEIQDELNDRIKDKVAPETKPLAHINHISLAFIDLPKKHSSQLNQLVGFFKNSVNKDIADASAAVNLLIDLFRKVETTLNNGNISKLMDESKRVTSVEIENAISIINNNQKAYNFWRVEGKEISKKLSIPIFEQQSMQQSIQDSFDFFKDLKQAEHRKVLKFTQDNKDLFHLAIDEVDCIEELYKMFLKTYSTPLSNKHLKAAIVAAYIETRESL